MSYSPGYLQSKIVFSWRCHNFKNSNHRPHVTCSALLLRNLVEIVNFIEAWGSELEISEKALSTFISLSFQAIQLVNSPAITPSLLSFHSQ